MKLTVYGFLCQYQRLARAARLGSSTRAGYQFLVAVLQSSDSIPEARLSVQARLVSLGREANSRRGQRQEGILNQIAILEHFLAEQTQMGY